MANKTMGASPTSSPSTSPRSAHANPTSLPGSARRRPRPEGQHADRAGAGRIHALLVRADRSSPGIEVGTFTGYSSLAVTLAIPEDGRLVAATSARSGPRWRAEYWEDAGVPGIDLRIAPATETLDARSPMTSRRLRLRLHRRRQGRLHRVLRAVAAARPTGRLDRRRQHAVERRRARHRPDRRRHAGSPGAQRKLARDERVTLCLLPVADGVTLARRR